MDELWSAPAKVNLTLRVGRPRSDGYHPLDSLVQTIDLSDRLGLRDAGEDELRVEGADLPTDGDNLVWKAVESLGVEGRSPVEVTLEKRIPFGAGLGGGSSDAAAVIAALGDRYGIDEPSRAAAALRTGADVTFFLTGGAARMEGIGERITRLDPLEGFVVVVVAPEYRLSTPDVYRMWDRLEYPTGATVDNRRLPPALREFEVINDLAPAAVTVEPGLGDLLADLSERWDRPVMMSGSGSAVFACFADLDEAADAASAAVDAGETHACGLTARGVHRLDR
ncbi:MAG: 4-(cytidine 5'-diphospho)-2-C-methyl-D-erythritol kinase [Acidimicrobiia bacterium]|nr:4-(cytidine 5'-diphospho)-2-C-methyl-D-erythritol kinase [Acidimicrobiia bacterium]